MSYIHLDQFHYINPRACVILHASNCTRTSRKHKKISPNKPVFMVKSGVLQPQIYSNACRDGNTCVRVLYHMHIQCVCHIVNQTLVWNASPSQEQPPQERQGVWETHIAITVLRQWNVVNLHLSQYYAVDHKLTQCWPQSSRLCLHVWNVWHGSTYKTHVHCDHNLFPEKTYILNRTVI